MPHTRYGYHSIPLQIWVGAWIRPYFMNKKNIYNKKKMGVEGFINHFMEKPSTRWIECMGIPIG